jgi:hypothetical protein
MAKPIAKASTKAREYFVRAAAAGDPSQTREE